MNVFGKVKVKPGITEKTFECRRGNLFVMVPDPILGSHLEFNCIYHQICRNTVKLPLIRS